MALSRVKVTKLVCLLALLLCEPVAGQDLPPEVLADSYLIEATRAIESGNFEASVQSLRKAEALDVKPLPELIYAYGKALVEQSSNEEAWHEGILLFKKFIIETGRNAEFYTHALRLVLIAEAKLKEAEVKVVLEDRLPEVHRRVSAWMVRVEGGHFTMGSHQSRCFATKTKIRRTV